MSVLQPIPPPYDPLQWVNKPFAERSRMACEAWAKVMGFRRSVQDQCGFEEGELRCIFVEAQPLGRPTMGYRILDAKTGLVEEGELDVRPMLQRQPWAAE